MKLFLKNSSIGLVALFSILPHAALSVEMNKKTALICASTLVAVVLTCYKSATTFIEHRDIESMNNAIAEAKNIEFFIKRVYYPRINESVVIPLESRGTTDIQNALLLADTAIKQQVMLGNRSNPRIAAQFPFIAFQQQIITDQKRLIATLIKVDEAQCKYYSKYSKRRLDDWRLENIGSEIASLRLEVLNDKVSFIRHRIPLLPETHDEYQKFESWEKEHSTLALK